MTKVTSTIRLLFNIETVKLFHSKFDLINFISISFLSLYICFHVVFDCFKNVRSNNLMECFDLKEH